MAYGTQVYGTSVYSQSGGASTPTETPVDQGKTYETNIDFPIRFGADCDIALASDEQSLLNNAKLSVMVQRKGIPLMTHLGSLVPVMPFDPNDEATLAAVAAEIDRSIKVGEPRAVADTVIRLAVNQDGEVIGVAIPLAFTKARDWKTVTLEIPPPTDL